MSNSSSSIHPQSSMPSCLAFAVIVQSRLAAFSNSGAARSY